jgi:Arc/MetJ family transcription regulator
MTTIQITLPDKLAQEAQKAGLLSSESLEELLRRQLKARAASELLSALDKMDGVDTDEDFSPEAMAEEVRAMRAERRASRTDS